MFKIEGLPMNWLFQLTECYLALSSWDELSSWKKREVEFLANENGDSTRKYVSLET